MSDLPDPSPALPADDTGSLALVAEALSPLRPRTLFVLDERRGVVAVRRGPRPVDPEAIASLELSVPGWLGARDSLSLPRTSCERALPIVAHRVGVGPRSRGVIVAVTESWPDGFRPDESWRAELSAICEMAWIAIRAWVSRLDGERSPIERLEREVARLRKDLDRTTARAEEAIRVKDDFLTNMSHEIRTPLTAILGHADLLISEETTDEERREYSRTIRHSSNHLLAIVNDLLDISRLQSGSIEIEPEPTDVARVLASVMEQHRAEAQRKGLRLSLEYSTRIPDRIRTDPKRLRQICTNLVGNAVKFTSEGGVWVIAGMVGGEEDPLSRMRFEVIDTGVGLTPEQQKLVFDPFNQADSSVTRAHGGTGLGLAIARRLTYLLGGELRVHSRRGQGSKFSFTVATGSLDEVEWRTPPTGRFRKLPAAVEPRPTPRPGGRVLLVEDGPDNQRLVSAILRRAGMAVTIAENGQVGSDEALAAEAKDEPYDLILMDMQMPVLDGYQATARLRQLGYRHPIVALTAHALEGDRKKCLNAGCDDYMAKPIELPKLLQLVASYVPARADDTAA